jgi:hypothetical protein
MCRFKYDALGRRIQRTTNAGADERYVYDGQDVIADLNSSSAVTTTYFNGPGVDDHLRQTSTSTGVSYFITDHLNTTAALADANGKMLLRHSLTIRSATTRAARERVTPTPDASATLTRVYFITAPVSTTRNWEGSSARIRLGLEVVM